MPRSKSLSRSRSTMNMNRLSHGGGFGGKLGANPQEVAKVMDTIAMATVLLVVCALHAYHTQFVGRREGG